MDPGHDPDAPPAVAPPREVRYLLVFRVDKSLYAVEGGIVDHVSELGQIVPVPTAPAHFTGIVHDRGRVLAVVDLARILGARGAGGYRRLVALKLEGRPVAVLAHAVLGLREAAADELRPASRGEAITAGELDDPRGVVTLLDPGELLRRLRAEPAAHHAS